ncbi:hypothetical protein [Hymenobacter lucidus]|uniref:Uncharacterized protein n=1 Tax=Hymenobacter lucidus TaxID=2880930 RepID=A0ABS8AQJ9_9BACT|nr:hypothetical protein [Hymenobacter lucidus]MCB2408485.1 hypothetical protein [Hymenobacter lucidus]
MLAIVVLTLLGFMVGGPWGVFLGWLAIFGAVAVVGNVLVGGYLLWLLHRVVKQDVSTPDNAFQAATRCWLIGYVVLWLCIALDYFLPQANLLHPFTKRIGWVQFPLIMLLTLPLALLAFYLKRWHYQALQK